MNSATVEEWAVESLDDDIVDIRTGKLDSNCADEKGEYPFFTCAPHPLRINEFAFDCEAILLAGNNAEGIFHLNYYQGKFNAYQRTYVITVKNKKKLDLRYLYYHLQLSLNMLRDFSQGTSTKFLTMRILKGIEINLPSIEEQKEISKKLSDLDEKIRVSKQMNENLESIGRAVFKRWFVDFEFPNEEGKPYKSSDGKMVYNEELDKEIPEGWKVKPIDEIAHFLNGLALQKFPVRDGEEYLPVIKIRELRQGITESSDKANLDLPGEYIVNNGDVLFSWSGSLEVVIWGFGKGALNQHLFKVTSSKYPKWFFYYWVLHYLPEYRQIAADKATTMGHIQRRHLSASQVIVPDDKTLERMNKLLAPVLERISGIKVETKVLSEIRDLLLPKLMSGKIRIPVQKEKMEAQ
jgi:type I restriction enzyme S subunit